MKFRLVLLTILVSIGFFNPMGALSAQVLKLLFYVCVLASLAVGMADGVSLRGVKYPRAAYAVLLCSIAFSVVMASAFHMQTLKVSILATLPFLMAYLYFYALMKLDVDPGKIMRAYFVLAALSVLVYFANVATMPNNIFGEPILEDVSRGIIRIPVVLIELFPLFLFYAINKWLIEKKKKWLWVIAVVTLMIVLSVIRQVILFSAMLGLFLFFRNISWKYKALMAAGVAAVVVFVLPMIPMYNTMIELSENQMDENDEEENIRITDYRYYTYENQTNALTPFFGNGVPSMGVSRWGIMYETETEESCLGTGDVGWAGFFWYFGIFGTVALAVILIKAMLKKKAPGQQYLTYWFAFFFLNNIAAAPSLYYSQIVSLAVCLYFVYRKDGDEQGVEPEPELAQAPRRGYPQLEIGKKR